jgi:hypothetical protein
VQGWNALHRDFNRLVIKHRERLAGTNRGGADLETKFRHLKTAYANDQVLEAAIESVSKDTTDFDEAWKDRGGTYSKLHELFGGLVTVFPGTPSVESDFSYLKMTSGKHSTSLTDLILESNLHANQFFELQTIKLD